jgi:hypothetical protein
MRWTTNVGSLYGNDSQPNQTTPPPHANQIFFFSQK